MEKLQHRKDSDLPPLPDKLIRAKPGSVINPIAVQPIEILGRKEDMQKKLIEPIIEKQRIINNLTPKFNADDAINKDGLQKAIEEWRKSQGSR